MAMKPLFMVEELAEMMRSTTWNAGPSLTPDPLLTCDICGRRSRRDVCEGSDGIMRCDKCRNRAFYQGQFTRNKLVI